MMNRRTFLKQTGAFSAALFLPACLNKVKEEKKNPYLLVVSGWQDVNIGDIAHTPGLLHILQTHLPEATITLWKRSKSEKVEALLKKNFPEIEILYGNPDKDFTITDSRLSIMLMSLFMDRGHRLWRPTVWRLGVKLRINLSEPTEQRFRIYLLH